MQGTPTPTHPTAFIKPMSSLTGSGKPVVVPPQCPDMIDYEGEFWTLDQAILGAEPYGERPPEIWVAAHRPRVLRAGPSSSVARALERSSSPRGTTRS